MDVACLGHFTSESLSPPLASHLWFKLSCLVDVLFERICLASSRSHRHHLETDQELHPEADSRQPVLRSVWEGHQRGGQYVVRAGTGRTPAHLKG